MSLGDEKRTSILPVASPSVDFLGPNYDYADELPMPNAVGVRAGGNLSDVTDAVKGVAYYADMIGYGEASNFLTRSMNNKPFPMGAGAGGGVKGELRGGGKRSREREGENEREKIRV